ncbi:RelA/SpoT domain-containing protein [Psychrobacter sp. SCQQ22]|uniref:RelA/SpoT domain-containing protein n=1 Tax=Psychrobacter sp. SCQQ22 TaxID=2792059 RepID=UPI0018CFDA19|nr:RelA/SpoT domain-containing protein [Psychrobacter sp. SCQQ22]MBH0087210.1 RelA/SpoT domain-containing protein [Psychrobacter sp. SCQQ22]
MSLKNEIFTIKGLQTKDLKEAQIEEQTLIDIIDDYNKLVKNLEVQANYFSNILHMCEDINSVKWRTKDPIHLLIKIVRKRKEAIVDGNDSSKYMNIDANNYKCIVNDLVGLRAIYLFKAQWSLIDEYIFENFRVCEDEAVILYYANDDDISHYQDDERLKKQEDVYTKNFNNNDYSYNFECKSSRYRSTHYVIEGLPPNSFKFELQTRTILEEAWGEIDHYIRYPEYENNPELIRRMSILNGVLSSCEEHSTTFHDYYRKIELSKAESLVESQSEETENSIESDSEHEAENVSSDTKDIVENDSKSSWDKDVSDIALNKQANRLLKILNSTQSPIIALNKDRAGMLSIGERLKDLNLGPVGSLGSVDSSIRINKALENIRKSTLPHNLTVGSALDPKVSDILKNYERQNTISNSLAEALKPFEKQQSNLEKIRKSIEPSSKIDEVQQSINNTKDENEDDSSS